MERISATYFIGRWIVVISGLISILIGGMYLQAGDEGVLGIGFTLYTIFSGGIVAFSYLEFLVPVPTRGVSPSVLSFVYYLPVTHSSLLHLLV